MNLKVLSCDQPAGQFLVAVMQATDVIRIAKSNPRIYDPQKKETGGGVQREKTEARIADISKYSATMDAAFPTPIILTLKADMYTIPEKGVIELPDNCEADIVDGQHRVEGLKASSFAKEFELPVVFLLEATEEQKALLFATVNGKQTKVPSSLIYDLFGVTTTRSPEKTCHEIARAMNQNKKSAWNGKLKMLGKKTPDSEEILSQGTFVKELLPMISSDPMGDRDKIKRGESPPPSTDMKCVFNEYFIADKDAVILRILMNVFAAAKATWPQEWEAPETSILTKSVGFTGIMKALPSLVAAGKEKNTLDLGFFSEAFDQAKVQLREKSLTLNSTHFAAGAGATKLSKLLTGDSNDAGA